MKLSKLFTFFTLLMFTGMAFGNELKEQMEIMDVAFDEVVNLVESQAEYTAIEAEVETFLSAAELSRQLIPDNIKSGSKTEREAAIKRYQELFDQLVADMRLLLEGIQAQDYDLGLAQIKKMKALKKQGHKEFK